MADIGKATISVVPDASGFKQALDEQIGTLSVPVGSKGWDFFWTVAGLLLLAASPAFLWAVYGWAF